MATAIDVSALWESCISSLVPTSYASAGASANDGLSATTAAWETATAFLAPKVLEESAAELNPTEDVIKAVAVLQEVDMAGDLLKWHTEQVAAAFKTLIASEVEQNIHDIQTLLLRLATYLQVWSQPYDALSSHVSSSSSSPSPVFTFRKHFLAHLYPLLTATDFFAALKTFFQSTMTLADMEEDRQATAINVLRAIHYLSFLERFEPLLLSIVYSLIEDRMFSIHAGDFETENQLQSIGEWLTNDIASWLVSIYTLAYTEDNDEAARIQAIKTLRPAMQRFEWHIYSELFKLRSSELFDIIVDYPTSEPAILDLKICLEKTDQKAILIRSLTRQVKKRLLHPGADTRDILTQYISLIRVLRILDPPGVLMAKIAGGMRSYLRGRDDTIRCIVSGMIEEDSELMNELQGRAGGGDSGESNLETARQLTEKQEEQAEDYTDDNYSYVPAPIDAPADYSRNKKADIIQLLVSIYDTKELFIKELQTLLADRLLQIKDYAFDKELRNVEVLKIRFGEQALAGLEVMLKDLADSKRTDVQVHNASTMTQNPVHATIISHLFWPEFAKTSIKLPGQLARQAAAYENTYRAIKPEKKLNWIPSLGSVSLEIQLTDRKLDLEVSVLQAAVLEVFSERDDSKRSLKEVQERLKVADESLVRAALIFWHKQGVLAGTLHHGLDPTDEDVENPMYFVLERAITPEPERVAARAQADLAASKVVSHMPSLSTSASASSRPSTSIQHHWPWIQNALTNLGALPSVRLQNMMNALVPGYVGHTLFELEAFLESAKSEGVIAKGKDGMWKLISQ